MWVKILVKKEACKSLSGKYSPGMLVMDQKLLDRPKQSATDAFKTASKRSIQKNNRSNCWFNWS